jgi:hypothetical protein
LFQLYIYVCALLVYSQSGCEFARTRRALVHWEIFKNPWNKERALRLADALNLEYPFLKDQTLEVFFGSFDYGTAAMTMRGQAKREGFWNLNHDFVDDVVGVYEPFKPLYEKVGFKWKK